MKPLFKQAIIFGMTIILAAPLFFSSSIANAGASSVAASTIKIDPQVQAAINDLQPGEMLAVIHPERADRSEPYSKCFPRCPAARGDPRLASYS